MYWRGAFHQKAGRVAYPLKRELVECLHPISQSGRDLAAPCREAITPSAPSPSATVGGTHHAKQKALVAACRRAPSLRCDAD